MTTMLKALSVQGKKNLLVIDADARNIYLSGRNIRDIAIRPVEQLCAYDVVRNENIIFGNERLIDKVRFAILPSQKRTRSCGKRTTAMFLKW